MTEIARGVSILNADPEALAQLFERATESGELRVMNSQFYREFPQEQLSAFAHQLGAYCLPTNGLIDLLDKLILEASPSRSAIEIGAGNGIIGRALGIPCTDNRMQERMDIKALYKASGQPVVRYGDHVQKLNAREAVLHCKPEVVVAAWVTHIYNPAEHWRGGNAFGVDEAAMLKKIKRYIFVGHRSPHQFKPLLDLEPREIVDPCLFSRSMDASGNVIWVWDNPDYQRDAKHDPEYLS